MSVAKLLAYIPRGNALDEDVWRKRHTLLLWTLLVHVPGLLLFGLFRGKSLSYSTLAVLVPALCLLGGWVLRRRRRLASFFVTVGLVYCSAALVGLSDGSIEAHFHFFIIIGFTALYQDWVPFLWNIAFTVVSHGLGSVFERDLIFNHSAGQANPWLWSGIHGFSVLLACAGVVIFWEANEKEQKKTVELTRRLAGAEIAHRKFTSDLLVNLARRNQSLLYRQLSVINQLEEEEKDPDALANLFRLDHLATRIRRNAESLLVLSGEQPPRTWTRPVPLLDVVRAAIAETEDLDRVVFSIDERLAVSGNAVADLTHLLAELVENAARFSPPDTSVDVRVRPDVQTGGVVLTVEDCGVGMPRKDLNAANELLAHPPEVDLSVSQRLGLHVVARLAQRRGVRVQLTPTPGGGVTAVVALSPSLLGSAQPDAPAREPAHVGPRSHRSPGHVPDGNPGLGRQRWREAPYLQPAAEWHAVNHRRAGAPAPSPEARAFPQAAAMPSFEEPPAGVEPAPPAVELPAVAGGTPGLRLTRRVPQAHLVPELRRGEEDASGEPVDPSPARLPSAAQARAALSRYQASRRVARTTVQRRAAEGGRRGDGEGDRA